MEVKIKKLKSYLFFYYRRLIQKAQIVDKGTKNALKGTAKSTQII